jgi:hypothetical protein
LELLVVSVMMALITIAATSAYSAAVRYHTTVIPAREAFRAEEKFESYLRGLIERTMVDTSADTYFIFSVGGNGPVSGNTGDPPDTLTFTALGLPVSGAAANSELDFESRNESFGPQGGLAELNLSTTPVGDAADAAGLFLRTQRPADGDETQGGTERVLKGNIETIGFEAWDGLQWVTTWDTTTMATPRIPSLVRVTYTLNGDVEGTEHSLIVRLPRSDVSAENPVETEGGA